MSQAVEVAACQAGSPVRCDDQREVRYTCMHCVYLYPPYEPLELAAS